jgi:hypothetical protein
MVIMISPEHKKADLRFHRGLAFAGQSRIMDQREPLHSTEVSQELVYHTLHRFRWPLGFHLSCLCARFQRPRSPILGCHRHPPLRHQRDSQGPAVQGIPTRLHLRGELMRLLAAALHDAKGCLLQPGRPARVPRKAADRVKTDVRDSATLARIFPSGELTPVSIPQNGDEAIRDLAREREDAQFDMEVATRCAEKAKPIGAPPICARWLIEAVRPPTVGQRIVFQEYLRSVAKMSNAWGASKSSYFTPVNIRAGPAVDTAGSPNHARPMHDECSSKLPSPTVACPGSFARSRCARRPPRSHPDIERKVKLVLCKRFRWLLATLGVGRKVKKRPCLVWGQALDGHKFGGSEPTEVRMLNRR